MTKSYDATTHFETTCDNIIDVYKQVTGKDFDFSACKVSSNSLFRVKTCSSVRSRIRLRVEKEKSSFAYTHTSITLQIITEIFATTHKQPKKRTKIKTCIFTSLLFNLQYFLPLKTVHTTTTQKSPTPTLSCSEFHFFASYTSGLPFFEKR